MAAKFITIRVLAPAGKAKPSPAIGQALGSIGVNMMKFTKEFNAKTTQYKEEIPMRVRLSVHEDESFSFTTRLPPSSWFLKQAAGVPKGAAKTGKELVGKVHVKQLYEIARAKQQDSEDMKALPLESICRQLMGQMQSMGLEVDARTEADIKAERDALVARVESLKAAFAKAYKN